MPQHADIAVIGLAVMGRNLILNMNDHGIRVAAYNRTVDRVDEFMNGAAKGTAIIGAHSIEEMVGMLRWPRCIMLMVKAGKPVDEFIELLLPHLPSGSIIIDGGNSHFSDTARRMDYLESKGIFFIGTGISGGEEGARHGPSIMPGGSAGAWPVVGEIFRAIAAKTPAGEPCCDWIGPRGAGHFVKMVHNGIEYGDMQLIAEAYHIMRDGLGMRAPAIGKAFAAWNKGDLDSYLIQITADIFSCKDRDGTPLIDRILDRAEQKGTGSWTVSAALELGVPVTLISEAVFARALSAARNERLQAAATLTGPPMRSKTGDTARRITDIGNALFAAKIVSYAQGFDLMRAASAQNGWNLDFGNIARLWRGGCIIRSAFLDRITEAYAGKPGLPNLLLDDYFKSAVRRCQPAWRRVAAQAALHGIPLPAMSSGLAWYDGRRCARLPANLLSAQRDYFGAHTYQRVDKPEGDYFHSNWAELREKAGAAQKKGA